MKKDFVSVILDDVVGVFMGFCRFCGSAGSGEMLGVCKRAPVVLGGVSLVPQVKRLC